MAWEALIEGCPVGSVVEIHGLAEEHTADWDSDINGQLGQILSYSAHETKKFSVCLANGRCGLVAPENVKLASHLQKPGEGGDEQSFDVLVSPGVPVEGLGQQISACLLEKGFCVLRLCQRPEAVEPALDKLKVSGTIGDLARFPEEVEEGYLGTGCKAKVKWLRASDQSLSGDDFIEDCDGFFTSVGQAFQPYSCDICGEWIDERTAPLLCLSLAPDEEEEYPSPEADDMILGHFLRSWRRSLLRAVRFAGPGTANFTLEGKETDKALRVPKLQSSVALSAVPQTVLLFRPDVYDYGCELPEETFMMITNFLSPAESLEVTKIEGDVSWLVADGPPPPAGDEHIYVMNTTERLPANWNNHYCYWAGLLSACDSVIKIPFQRGDIDIYWTPDTETFQSWQSTTRHQSFVEGAEMFDNRHFEISNAEASGMDPVMRLTLEAGAQSLAMMGITKKQTNRKSLHGGFCVGNDKLDWAALPKACDVGGALSGTSMNLAILANRFNFTFNLKGPSFVCDTACSASLTSTHCAKRCIQERDFDPLEFFLSMGSHLCLNVGNYVGGSQAHMHSPQGRCFTFNASADGYLRGEGVCGFMMKWGNYAHESEAILRATMIGQDGRSASITAPNGPAQEELINRAFKEGRMSPPESTVWECHGTGTSLGDPIEVGAVRKVQIRMKRIEPLLLTSVKTNMGHLEGAAAMGGMCKCILQSKYSKCCPTLHLRTLNPHLEHAAFEALFQTEGARYTYMQGHSQVSSFGFGGSNGHGIFWGRNLDAIPDIEQLFLKKLSERPVPQVRVTGKDPEEWEADFPDCRNVNSGAKWIVKLSPDDAPDEPVKWRFEEDGPDLDAEGDDIFYAITGNFNSWEDDQMAQGDVPGLFYSMAEIPTDGRLEFQILLDGDRTQVIAPASPECSRRATPILGPASGLKNKWVVMGTPGAEVRIELFSKRGMKSITWLIDGEAQ